MKSKQSFPGESAKRFVSYRANLDHQSESRIGTISQDDQLGSVGRSVCQTYCGVHEPVVEYISKGKSHKRYEFGYKVRVASTGRGGWFVGARRSMVIPITAKRCQRPLNRSQSPSRRLWIWGPVGDCLHAILSAAGMNFWKLLRWAVALFRQFFLWLFTCQRILAIEAMV